MISKAKFVKLIKEYQEFLKYLSKLDELKIDIIESQLHEYPCQLFDWIMRNSFDEDGEDWIGYYLYELPSINDPKIVDKDGNKIPLENLDDLWELVKDYRV